MRKNILLITLLIAVKTIMNAQDISKVKFYKYIYVSTVKYEQYDDDAWGVSNFVKKYFKKMGLEIQLTQARTMADSSLFLTCNILHFLPRKSMHEVIIEITNIRDEIVFQGSGKNGRIESSGTQAKEAANIALTKPEKPDIISIKASNISLNSSKKTITFEDSIRNYLAINKLDPIEGIYKSYQSGSLGYFKIGIIRNGEKYNALVLDTDFKNWLVGESKAIFEKTALKNVYSIRWSINHGDMQETFCVLDESAILSVELKDNKLVHSSIKSELIKIYPTATTTEKSSNHWTASGSGFFISKSGMIATNAHVVKDAKNIEISVLENEANKKYVGKLLFIDIENDVAVIQINDSSFKNKTTIPYKI